MVDFAKVKVERLKKYPLL